MEDKNVKIAKALGFQVGQSCGSVAISTNSDWKDKGPIGLGSYYYYPKPEPSMDCYHLPNFTKDLQQAVDHIVPWFTKRGWMIALHGENNTIEAYSNPVIAEHKRLNLMEIIDTSQGSVPSERMADALCSVLLEVFEDEKK